MNESSPDYRARLLRDVLVLQLKLLLDGIRDAALIPISLVAAILGLLRGGADADLEFRRVIKLGRRSERWINLFGHEAPLGRARPGGSLDQLLDRVEDVVMEQYSKGGNTEDARAAIKAAADDFKPDDSGPKDPADRPTPQ
jgi:hypothetical protein